MESLGTGGEEAGADGGNAGLDQLVYHPLSGFNLSHMSPFSSVGRRKTSLGLYSGHMSCVLAHGFTHEFSSRFISQDHSFALSAQTKVSAY